MKTKRVIAFVLSLLVGVVIAYEVIQRTPLLSVLESFRHQSPLAIELFLFASIMIMVLHAARWRLVIKSAGLNLPFWRVFSYKIVGYGVSFLTPAAKVGGEPIRAMMLQRHGWSFKRSFSTVAIDKIVELSVTSLLFIVGIFAVVLTLALPQSMTIALIILGVILVLLVIWFYYLIISHKNIVLSLFRFFRLHKWSLTKQFEQDIIDNDALLVSFYKHNSKAFTKAIILTFATWLFMFLEYMSALLLVGVSGVNFAGLFLIICMVAVAYMIPVPLALGVLEAGQVTTFLILGLQRAAGLGLSLVIRARDFAWTIISLPLLLVFSLRAKKIKKEHKSTGARGIKHD